ncbi:hypothetical protein CCGE525_37025 (plasmid) [Rhizobium jaguaris]|uniref:Uncharacterized protein n=1 Tax=Rhizobium jaguaris TaxID=1312183 RepID=A0A387G1E2_9HYPH|nr:hypothetical protein CCGE525_37025 [Rhizobium jaguaris]
MNRFAEQALASWFVSRRAGRLPAVSEVPCQSTGHRGCTRHASMTVRPILIALQQMSRMLQVSLQALIGRRLQDAVPQPICDSYLRWQRIDASSPMASAQYRVEPGSGEP